MVWWWIGVAALVAVIGVTILLANRVVRPVREIARYADDIVEHGVGAVGQLDALPEIRRTVAYVVKGREVVERYIQGLRRIA